MKSSQPAEHIIILQVVSNRLVWLESEKQEETVGILSGGEVPLDSISETAADDAQRLRAALGEVSAQLHLGWFTRYDVVYLLPSQRLTARFLETPPTEEAHINELVEFEVAETLQLPIEQVAWDYFLSSRHALSGEKLLLWVAAKKEYIQSLLAAWPQNLLFPNQITPVFTAIYECLLHTHPSLFEAPAIVLSQEGERANFMAASQQAIFFNRSIPLAQPKEPHAGEKLAGEINRTLGYLEERFAWGAIENLVLLGFEEWNLDALTAEALQQPLRITQLTRQDLLPQFSIETGELTSAHIPLLCHAFARHKQSQRGLNLLKEKPKHSLWQTWTPDTAIPMKQFGVYTVSLLGAFVILWGGQNLWLAYAAADRAEKGQELLRLAERLKQEEIGLRNLARRDIKYADALLFLSETLPEDMIAQTMSLDQENGIALALTGGDQQKVVELIQKMNESRWFRGVTLDRAANERDGFVVYLSGELRSR